MLVVQFVLWFSLLVSKCLYMLRLGVDGLRLSGLVVYCFSVLVSMSPPKVLGLCFGANFEINWAGGGGEGSICWPMWFSWTGEVVSLSCERFGVLSSLSVTQGRQCGLILGVN